MTRGDPQSPLRWTCKSRAKLAAALSNAGWKVSTTTVGRLLHELGYRLQSVRKSREGTSPPDRNAQFEHINSKAEEFLQRDQPVVSVDTKNKELVGDFKNAGREWQPRGEPEKSLVHDFPQDATGKAIPYGIYDMGRNEAWVSVGCDWWATHSRLKPMRDFAWMLRRHEQGILNYFRVPIDNGTVEGLNNKAKLVIHKAYGFRTAKNYIRNLYHCLGNLPLPQTVHTFV